MIRSAAVLIVLAAALLSAPPPEEKISMSTSKGIGPVKEWKPGPVDAALAAKGKRVYNAQCIVCHLYDKRKIGGPLRDIAKRRTPEYIINKMLNPVEMAEKDPDNIPARTAYTISMPVMTITEEEAVAVYEYLRSLPPVAEKTPAAAPAPGLKPKANTPAFPGAAPATPLPATPAPQATPPPAEPPPAK